MCDPLSIQDQSVRGSNYCKFLCVLSTGREREREKKEGERESGDSSSHTLQVIHSSLNSDVYSKLMKTFLSTAAFSSAELILLLQLHCLVWPPFPPSLTAGLIC